MALPDTRISAAQRAEFIKLFTAAVIHYVQNCCIPADPETDEPGSAQYNPNHHGLAVLKSLRGWTYLKNAYWELQLQPVLQPPRLRKPTQPGADTSPPPASNNADDASGDEIPSQRPRHRFATLEQPSVLPPVSLIESTTDSEGTNRPSRRATGRRSKSYKPARETRKREISKPPEWFLEAAGLATAMAVTGDREDDSAGDATSTGADDPVLPQTASAGTIAPETPVTIGTLLPPFAAVVGVTLLVCLICKYKPCCGGRGPNRAEYQPIPDSSVPVARATA
jgi:hypothetical protein